MKNKISTLLFAVLASVCMVNAASYSNIKIGNLYYNLNDDYGYWENNQYYQDYYRAEVTSNPNKYSGKVVVPDSVTYQGQKYAVKSIGSSAFQDCSNLTMVELPVGITIINSNAFRNCGSLLSVNIPEGVTRIGGSAFYYCTSLSAIDFPNSLTNIDGSAFYNCDNLLSIVIPDNVTNIEGHAFYDCDKLSSVTIGKGVTSIGSSAFYSCDALKAVYISDLSAWCKIAFDGSSANPCYNGHHLYLNGEEITALVIPEDITSIKQYAFYGCSEISSVIIPNSVTSIETSAFGSCSNLQSVSLGKNIANLNKDAFSSCNKLSSVEWNITNFIDFASATLSPFYNYRNTITSFTFGNNVEHIPAFLCCEMSNLSRIDIPASVTSVGEGAFAFCSRLTAINAAAGSPLYSSVDGVLFSKDKTSLIIYPAGKSATTYTIPNTVKTIEENAFYGCTNLSSVTVPASVTSIKAGNAIIPMWYFSGITPASIVENVFANDVFLIVENADTYKAAWPAYESRIFPRITAKLTMDLQALSDKSALHMAVGEPNLENVIDLTISGTINSYDLMIMRNKMINLRYLDLTEASIVANPYEYYTGICSHADTLLAHSFRNLTSVKLPRTLKYAEQAMIDCPDIKYAEFNGGVLGTKVLPYDGDGDLQVVCNEGVTKIMPYAFIASDRTHKYYTDNSYNTKLRSISLPNSLGIIESKRFWYCRNLQEVILGDAITEIQDYAFCECPALNEIRLPQQLIGIGNLAFQGTKIAEILIPQNTKRIGNFAFLGALNSSNWSSGTETLSSGISMTNDGASDLYHYYNNKLEGGRLGVGQDGYSYYFYFGGSSLQKLSFAPNSKLNEIGTCAFAFAQIDSIAVPDSVATIGKYAFAGNKSLKSVKFGENSAVRTIDRGVFQNCDAMTEVVLPSELAQIEELAFSCHTGKDELKAIGFPAKLKAINRAAFYGRKGLEIISFPTSLQTIGDFAFQGCTGLDEIRVPSTLLSVGDYAFDDCSHVTKVYTYTVEPVNIDQNTFSCWHSADLYVPATSYYTYFYNTQWSQFLSLKPFDEEYSYFYINNDYELGGDNGTIEGTPNADLNPNSGLIVTGDDPQEVGTVTVNGDDNNAASIIACGDNLLIDSLVIRLNTRKNHWSYFCFPFDVNLSQLHFDYQYVIREYDGETRARHGAGGWVNFTGNVLQKGKGYIFQGAKTAELVIKIKNPLISCADFEQIVVAHSSGNSVNSNWNFIGNPFPSWYDMAELLFGGFSSPVYIWDGTDYKVYRPGDDEYHFHPYEGFFTQPESTQGIIVWASSGRETKKQADEKSSKANMPARRVRQAAQQRSLINLTLASEDYSDNTRIVFNNAATMDYEVGRDAVKMDGGNGAIHLWSMEYEDAATRYAINERPFGTIQVGLGYDVAEDGFYTLSASRMDTAVVIYDNELNQEVDLANGDYYFYTAAGTNTSRFSICRIKQATETATSIDNVAAEADQIVNVYTILGTKIQSNVRRGDLKLEKGLYVLENTNGERSQLMIEQ